MTFKRLTAILSVALVGTASSPAQAAIYYPEPSPVSEYVYDGSLQFLMHSSGWTQYDDYDIMAVDAFPTLDPMTGQYESAQVEWNYEGSPYDYMLQPGDIYNHQEEHGSGFMYDYAAPVGQRYAYMIYQEGSLSTNAPTYVVRIDNNGNFEFVAQIYQDFVSGRQEFTMSADGELLRVVSTDGTLHNYGSLRDLPAMGDNPGGGYTWADRFDTPVISVVDRFGDLNPDATEVFGTSSWPAENNDQNTQASVSTMVIDGEEYVIFWDDSYFDGFGGTHLFRISDLSYVGELDLTSSTDISAGTGWWDANNPEFGIDVSAVSSVGNVNYVVHSNYFAPEGSSLASNRYWALGVLDPSSVDLVNMTATVVDISLIGGMDTYNTNGMQAPAAQLNITVPPAPAPVAHLFFDGNGGKFYGTEEGTLDVAGPSTDSTSETITVSPEVGSESDLEPTRTDFVFLGWNTEADGSGTSYSVGDDFILSSEAGGTDTLYAQWGPVVPPTVEFEEQGGTEVTDPVCEIDGTFTIPAAPTREGYTFAGWNSEADGSGTAYPVGSEVDCADMVIYALWTQDAVIIPPTVEFEEQGGTEVTDPVCEIDGTFTIPAAPTRDGYTFAGWNSAADGSGGAFSIGAEVDCADMVIFALWNQDIEIPSEIELPETGMDAAQMRLGLMLAMASALLGAMSMLAAAATRRR